MVSSSAQASLRKAANSRPVEFGARVGHAVNGLVHMLIGGLAIAVALGTARDADQSGALSALSRTPFGAVLLWVVVIGLGALGLWQLLQTALVRESDRKRRWMRRLKEAGKAVAYLALAATALRFATGGSADSEEQSQDFSAGILAQPFGIVLLLLVGLLVIGIGVYFVVKGVRKKFLEDLQTPAGTTGDVIEVLGVVGFVAKGVALGVVGILFAVAAFTVDPDRATGLDGALKALAELPFGVAVLIAVGIGFLAYGVYCVVRAFRSTRI
jgi:hypothetical protein